ncbi:MAG: hypothetical protein EPO26_16750 [Chloroflexota bacterium]|nr:MAG: hypothetical protein EPO26_16750 [Chloroflexota bacterium]
MRRQIVGPRIVAILGALLMILAPWLANGHAAAQVTEPVKFRVEITDAGFGSKGEGPALEVERGQSVELTFAWAHVAHVNDVHIIVLPAYKLESDKLTASNREYTFSFVADKTGTFDFKCDLDCEIHDRLQKGSIRVKGAGTAAAPSLKATTLSLTPTVGRDNLALMAVLKDTGGAPVSKAEVRFYVDAEFVGTFGKMEIGRAKTDANGVAFLDYRPTLPLSEQRFTVRFEGLGLHSESDRTVLVVLPSADALPAAYAVAPIGLEPIRNTAPFVLALLIGGVWTTFGFVLRQLAGIFAESAEA